jgi:thymidylate synthase
MQSSKSPQTSPTSEKPACNKADRIYLDLLKDIHENGNLEGDSRTGVGTRSVFGRMIRFKMSEGFPLITTRKMFAKAGIYELLWFIGNHLNDPKYQKFGRSNAKYLIDNGVNIWVGDLYKAYVNHVNYSNDYAKNSTYGYLNEHITEWATNGGTPLTKEEFIERIKTDDEFAETYADCGNIYGTQWREWTVTCGKRVTKIDQFANIIKKLKTNPTDRRIMVSAWNVPDIENNTMVLPPCHYGFTLYTRLLTLDERIELASKDPHFDVLDFGIGSELPDEHCHKICDSYGVPKRALSLLWNQRSVDTPLGLPTNIMSYALLLNMIAEEVDMVADELIGSLENTHYYLNQEDGVKEHLTREVLHALPTLWLNPEKSMFDYTYEDIKILSYEAQPKINYPLSN